MIVPAELDLVAFRNGVFRQQVTLQGNGVALNLTGYSAYRLQLRLPGDEVDPAKLDLTTVANGNGSKLTVVTAASGIVEILIAIADLAALPVSSPETQRRLASGRKVDAERFDYDLVINNGTDLNVYLFGNLFLNEGTTK